MADGKPPAIGIGDRVALLGTIVEVRQHYAMVNVDGVTPPGTYISVDYASLLQVRKPDGPERGP